MLTSDAAVHATGLDGLALKPTETDVSLAADLPFEFLVVDWEGHEHVPDRDVLAGLAASTTVHVTIPVRADGFDPLGDDRRLAGLPATVERVFVAGHPAYLDEVERSRSVSPRLGAAATRDPDAWVGTESVERFALATGNTQFELLAGSTARTIRGLRAAGFEGGIAVYAPTVLSADDDVVLDALGEYVARRGPVAAALGDDAVTDAAATGRDRAVLLDAVGEYALVGEAADVREQVRTLKDAGADHVVGYPARGPTAVGD